MSAAAGRFIMMHRTDARWEAGERPSPELISEMGRLIGQMAQAGALLGGEGLRASSTGVRLGGSGRGGVTPGPYAASSFLPAGFLVVALASIAEAAAWASRLLESAPDIEIDVRPVTEPWDLGVSSKPDGLATTRFMLLYKVEPRAEADLLGAAGPRARLAGVQAAMQRTGVLLLAEHFQPSAQGTRLVFAGGRRTLIDGPFAESKELIAGYCLLRGSKDEALEWAGRFAAVVGDVELDVRQVFADSSGR